MPGVGVSYFGKFDIYQKTNFCRRWSVHQFAITTSITVTSMPRPDPSSRSASSTSRRKSSSDDDPRSNQRRRRSTDDRMKGANPQTTRRALKATRQSNSTGDLDVMQSALRVKTQYESLKRNGLRRSRENTKKKISFSFLEVKEFPMIL